MLGCECFEIILGRHGSNTAVACCYAMTKRCRPRIRNTHTLERGWNMNTQTPRTYGLRVLSMSALALVLAQAPVHLDLSNLSLHVTQAYADSGSSCFVANTKVRMADGSLRAIEAIEVGDQVLGRDGRVNTVMEIERVPLGRRKLYAFNGGRPFVTEEHPFMTRHGWRSIEPDSTREENPKLIVAPLREEIPKDRVSPPES